MENKKLLFIDIETVAETNNYYTYPKKEIRANRYCNDIWDLTEQEAYYKKAWLNPEFSKIICISFWSKTADDEIRTCSIFGFDEKTIIDEFFKLLSKMPEYELAGHNIKSFDLPFIFRRAIINGIKPHDKISFYDMKPWDIKVVDTIELWKNGWYISAWLETICLCLWIPSPKSNMSGDKIFDYYYGSNMVDKDNRKPIAEYCEWDVRSTMRVYDKIMDPTKTFNIQQPELFSGTYNKKQLTAVEVSAKIENIERLKSFEIEAIMIEEIEKEYELTEEQKQVLGKARREVRNQENGSKKDNDFPF